MRSPTANAKILCSGALSAWREERSFADGLRGCGKHGKRPIWSLKKPNERCADVVLESSSCALAHIGFRSMSSRTTGGMTVEKLRANSTTR